MTFEIAKISDIPALVFLLEKLFKQEAEFYPDQEIQANGLRQIISNGNVGFILLARNEENIIGMVNVLFTISTATGGRVAILEDMIILPEARGGGAGSRLLKQAIETAKEKGVQRITLLTDSDNYSAHKFYERNGFSKSSMIAFRQSICE